MLSLVLVIIAGCASRVQVVPVYVDGMCLSPNLPLEMSPEDQLVRRSMERVVSLNEEWERKCRAAAESQLSTPSGTVAVSPI